MPTLWLMFDHEGSTLDATKMSFYIRKSVKREKSIEK